MSILLSTNILVSRFTHFHVLTRTIPYFTYTMIQVYFVTNPLLPNGREQTICSTPFFVEVIYSPLIYSPIEQRSSYYFTHHNAIICGFINVEGRKPSITKMAIP